jgi:redox-sensitive bicupin YhaK (pirin superfamily)
VIERRQFQSLSGARSDWLQAKYHFSPMEARSGWGALRIWNDDEIAPNSGFPPHSHSNMEIITYVRDGAVTHRDSLGNGGRIAAGDVQVMSAGTGIKHNEFNLEQQTTRLFQIWIGRRCSCMGYQAIPEEGSRRLFRYLGERLRERP